MLVTPWSCAGCPGRCQNKPGSGAGRRLAGAQGRKLKSEHKRFRFTGGVRPWALPRVLALPLTDGIGRKPAALAQLGRGMWIVCWGDRKESGAEGCGL